MNLLQIAIASGNDDYDSLGTDDLVEVSRGLRPFDQFMATNRAIRDSICPPPRHHCTSVDATRTRCYRVILPYFNIMFFSVM